MSQKSVRPVTTPDYRELARRRLPRFLFDYIDGGANDERTMAANQEDFQRFCLRQRVLRDVSRIDTSTVMSGLKVSMPLALAPVGMAGMMARRGEAQAVKAANAIGVPHTLSTVGICPLEEIRQTATAPFWFQLYMLRDREVVLRLLEQARSAGVETLLFTVDLAVAGKRHRDWRNGMLGEDLPARLARARQLLAHPRWVYDVGLRGRPHEFGNLRDVMSDSRDLQAYKNFISAQFDPSVTWEDITWLRGQWHGRILIKGVMSADDALAAADTGADGVIVSNHGGRQLDGVSSTILKLPEVVAAAGEKIEVYMDGGVRSGIDVVKAVALGAQGVFIGRPWVWALAGRGEGGLRELLTVFQQEIATAMGLMGVNRIEELTPDLVERN